MFVLLPARRAQGCRNTVGGCASSECDFMFNKCWPARSSSRSWFRASPGRRAARASMSIVLVGLGHLHVQGRLGVASVETDDRQSFRFERMPMPGRKRSALQSYSDRARRLGFDGTGNAPRGRKAGALPSMHFDTRFGVVAVRSGGRLWAQSSKTRRWHAAPKTGREPDSLQGAR